MIVDRAAAIELSCRKGISFQAASALLQSQARPGDTSGRSARPSIPSHPARDGGEAAILNGKRALHAARVNPAPAPSEEGHDSGKGGDADFVPQPAVDPATLPPPPPPSPRLDLPAPQRTAELAAIEAWLTANPVRRKEPDWGDLQAEWRVFQRAGDFVARLAKIKPGPPMYTINGARVTKPEFKRRARALARQRGWEVPE